MQESVDKSHWGVGGEAEGRRPRASGSEAVSAGNSTQATPRELCLQGVPLRLLLSAAIGNDGTGYLSPLLPVLSRLHLPLGTLPHFAGFECMHLTGGA